MTQEKFAIVVHGGAGPRSHYLEAHREASETGIKKALQAGYDILQKGGSALDAVAQAVVILEDDSHFNAGRGSVVNAEGEVEMDAAIMDGATLAAGAVSMVRQVKNPILLTRQIMENTRHVYLSGYGALRAAQQFGLELMAEDYFLTDFHKEEYQRFLTEQKGDDKIRGTVGAVACDQAGNIAAGTSTGGTSYSLPGRIGDSCVIGAGCYANNRSCAVSGTGEGEYLIRGVVAHTIAMQVELKHLTLQEACNLVIKTHDRRTIGEMGVIAINPKAEIATAFNTELMRHGWINSEGKMYIMAF